MLLILSATLGLATKQVDYTLAFAQAPLAKGEVIFVEMPKGYEIEGKVYKLKKSIYGLHQGPINFYNHLKEGLEERGFVQSKFEPCLFSNGKAICLVYVDDVLWFSKNEKDIDQAIQDLKEEERKSGKRNLLLK